MDEQFEYKLDDELEKTNSQAQDTLKPRSKKIIGAASGAAVGSVIPGLGSLLGAIIGYSVADSQWIAQKVDKMLEKHVD
jgi:hypothetical protein